MRVAYFVLGMHRSGTSAIASTFNSLGVSFGGALLPATEDNPKGYFENKAVQAFNESFLVNSGFGWDDTFFDLDQLSNNQRSDLVINAKKILDEEFGIFKTFGVKDPRLCILFPVWLEACEQLDIKVKVILAYRHPAEVAQSLKARNDFSMQHGLALWTEYMAKAERYSRGLDRIIIDFDRLITDFDGCSQTIVDFIDVSKLPKNANSTAIDANLRHFTHDQANLIGIPPCIETIIEQYASASLDPEILDQSVAEFFNLKRYFYNSHKQSLFSQFQAERIKYKALKDNYYDKWQRSEEAASNQAQKLDKLKDDIEKRDERVRAEANKNKQLEQDLSKVQHALNLSQIRAEKTRLEMVQLATESTSLQGQLKQKDAEFNAQAKNFERKQSKLISNFERDKQTLKDQFKLTTKQEIADTIARTDNQYEAWLTLLIKSFLPTFQHLSQRDTHSVKSKLKAIMHSDNLDQFLTRFLDVYKTAQQVPLSFIVNFEEEGYLAANEDVEVAVKDGDLSCGLEHFLLFGYGEARKGLRKIHPKRRFFATNEQELALQDKEYKDYLSTFYHKISKPKAIVTKPEKVKIPAAFARPIPNYLAELKPDVEIDIILPVYNALDDVKACIDSLYDNQTMPFKLLVIDDCSEEETRIWLEQEQRKRGFVLSRNPENLRFTKTVNKGFAQSQGDYVILLNSDTIVTRFWLEKLVHCFASDDKTGIVGPLSNAASWQTVPVREDKENGGWLINEIPVGYSIELMGQLVETISSRQYPNVPSVNGFCYAIKRDVIDQIGTLDEEYFPTGYGEEDDFSIRARKAGFTIKVADDTYVFHAKSKSYTQEVRKVLTVGGRKSLDKKHGKEEIEALIAAWKAEPCLPQIGKVIDSFMHVSSGNKRVVYTAIFGNYDNLNTPEYVNPDWDYVCFTDNKNITSDVFTVKYVDPIFDNTTKNARMMKILSHLFLINFDYSLWVDGSVKMRGRNINELIDKNLSNDYISLHKHIVRDCVYDEEEACAQMKKDGAEVLAKQVQCYRNEGLPESYGIFETAEISRDHTAIEVHQINAYWWQQLDKFSIRDQISLPYVFWKYSFKNHFMEGNQWLDAYFHIYKHAGAEVRLDKAVEIVIPIHDSDTDITKCVNDVFQTTAYPTFSVSLLIDKAVKLPESMLTEWTLKYGEKLAILCKDELSLPIISDHIKHSHHELCCLLEAQVTLINNDWLNKLVEGLLQDDAATIAGPTILDHDFNFVASGVRLKRKNGQVERIYNSRKLGGTGTVQALHQSCILLRTDQFRHLGGFHKQLQDLRSAFVALSHANTQSGKNSRLVLNSEVMVSADNEAISDFNALKAIVN